LLFCIKVVLSSLLLYARWSKGGDVGIGGDTAVDIGSTNFPSAIDINIACGILNPLHCCNTLLTLTLIGCALLNPSAVALSIMCALTCEKYLLNKRLLQLTMIVLSISECLHLN